MAMAEPVATSVDSSSDAQKSIRSDSSSLSDFGSIATVTTTIDSEDGGGQSNRTAQALNAGFQPVAQVAAVCEVNHHAIQDNDNDNDDDDDSTEPQNVWLDHDGGIDDLVSMLILARLHALRKIKLLGVSYIEADSIAKLAVYHTRVLIETFFPALKNEITFLFSDAPVDVPFVEMWRKAPQEQFERGWMKTFHQTPPPQRDGDGGDGDGDGTTFVCPSPDFIERVRERFSDCRERSITMIVTGPCTNVHRILEESDLERKVKEIIIMGGAISAAGNVAPLNLAEWNVYCDALPFLKVISNDYKRGGGVGDRVGDVASGYRTVVVSNDLSTQLPIADLVNRLQMEDGQNGLLTKESAGDGDAREVAGDGDAREVAGDVTRMGSPEGLRRLIKEMYLAIIEQGVEEYYLWDPSTVVVAMFRSLFNIERKRVHVGLRGEVRGVTQACCTKDKEAVCDVCRRGVVVVNDGDWSKVVSEVDWVCSCVDGSESVVTCLSALLCADDSLIVDLFAQVECAAAPSAVDV